MAENAVKIVQQENSGNVLVVAGLAHLEGIVNNLHQHLDLEEVRRVP